MRVAVIFAVLILSWGIPIGAQQTSMGKTLDPIVVRAHAIHPSDETVTQQVQTALRENPYLFSEHITVSTKNGVVTLGGVALDAWDLSTMKRLVRRMKGVRRVVDEIDLQLGGE